ncbi:(2Fe-2S)-binding protein [Candidatus Woesearchaeota archaeon]|nr:(2Fe-2S)-binding protein [Candidatus Woesearchaeota archaeon]
MAKVTIDGTEEEVQDGDSLNDVCEKHGVIFGCYAGVCGSCRIKVIEGAENLSEKTSEEDQLCEADNERLACQCNIKQGEVKLEKDD